MFVFKVKFQIDPGERLIPPQGYKTEDERFPLRVALRPPALAFSDMLRSALLCAVLGLLRAQPFPCPPACKCAFRDVAQCSGGDVARIAALGLPTNLTLILLSRMSRGALRNDSFSGMTVLQRLMLSDSHISAIAPGTFDDLIKLKTLRLSRNKIDHPLPREMARQHFWTHQRNAQTLLLALCWQLDPASHPPLFAGSRAPLWGTREPFPNTGQHKQAHSLPC